MSDLARRVLAWWMAGAPMWRANWRMLVDAWRDPSG